MTKEEVIAELKDMEDFNCQRYEDAVNEAIRLLTEEKVCEWTEHREQHRSNGLS